MHDQNPILRSLKIDVFVPNQIFGPEGGPEKMPGSNFQFFKLKKVLAPQGRGRPDLQSQEKH